MPATARGLGLTLDSWVDERCDPIKSTQAALAYLKAANRTYDDWLVSLASYNAGPGTVNRAISRTASGRTIGIFNLNYHVRHSMSQMPSGLCNALCRLLQNSDNLSQLQQQVSCEIFFSSKD